MSSAAAPAAPAANKTLRPRHLVGERPASVRFLVGKRAQRRAQILRAPGHRHQTLVLARIAVETDHGGRRFGRDDQELDVAGRDTRGDLQHIDIMRDEIDILDTVHLGNQNAVEARTNHRRQIFQRKSGAKRIDPDQERPIPLPAAQQLLDGLTGKRLSPRRHRVLQVEDQRIRADAGGLGEFSFAVGRHEKK